MRTIVFSDAHGEPDIIQAVVEHSCFDPHSDRLIFAGDAIEVGRDSAGCLALLDKLGCECLVGNHEYAVYDGWPLEPEVLPTDVEADVHRLIDGGLWRVAAESDGVLITHAGLSRSFAPDFEPFGAEHSVADFVASLNEEFAGAVKLGDFVAVRVVEEDGPLWYRPSESLPPLTGVLQVSGHTPPEMFGGSAVAECWAGVGFYMVDPCARCWRRRGFAPPVPLRYAVIENGNVRVVEEAE